MRNYSVGDWLRVCLLAPWQLLTNWERYEIYIVEMGIDGLQEPKNMEYLLKILRPDIAVILNVLLVHTEFFGNLENIAREKFKIIEAETSHQGELINCKYGYELDCSYESFKKGLTTREQYLNALSKCLSCAKKPVLIHVNSFSDLPNEREKITLNLKNLPTQEQLVNEQINDPFGKRIADFKDKKLEVLFTTKCNRGIDFPGEVCNSIIITRFPYPNISEIFWKILKKNKPIYFMSFYMDKAKRELLQRVYRGLRSKNDKVYLLSPDIRVLEFKFNNQPK